MILKYLSYLLKWAHYRLNSYETTPYSPMQVNLHEEEGSLLTYPKYKRTLTFRRKWAAIAVMDDAHTVLEMKNYSDKRFKIRYNQ